VEWAAALPYSNGKVGMFGASYVGATQWLAALEHPPHLVAIQPSLTASDYYEGWTYRGGALQQFFAESWTGELSLDNLDRSVMRATFPPAMVSHRPRKFCVAMLSLYLNRFAPYYLDWLEHPDRDEYWTRWEIDRHYASMPQRVLNIGGWYDIFRDGTLKNFNGMQKQGATQAARAGARLLIGPWYHGPAGCQTGALNFGESAKVDLADVMLDWYEEVLQNKPGKSSLRSPVRLFVMGINRWRDENEWPLARTIYTNFYLHSGRSASSLSGDGTLSQDVATDEQADAFTYNPEDPVPSRGGNLCCDNVKRPSGPFDQSTIETRKDVLVYTTPVLPKNLEVTGPLATELYVSSSAVDTDVTAKLVDVYPDGRSFNISEGILRLRYRESLETPKLLEPGHIYKVRVDLGATSNVFLAGHRIRLEISSSNFPNFNRNWNTAANPAYNGATVAAENRIFHDRAHPSVLILPVIPAR
jgi:putative CocE/NonD family hydrolase